MLSSDMIGKQFGYLTVLSQTDKRDARRCIVYQCQCSCGALRLVSGTDLRPATA